MENTETKTVNAETAAAVSPKKWTDATPAGLVALAVACACFFALLNGYVRAGAVPLIGCYLLGAFVVQIIVALIDLKEGKPAAGNTFLYFCGFFMLVSGIEMLVKHKYGAALDGRIDGYAWAALTLVTWLWTPAFFKKFSLLSILIVLVDIALPLIVLADFGVAPVILKKIAAWPFLLACLTAIYASAAAVVNTTYGKKVFPNFS
jgi:succinate-acetate transporter protein